MPNENATEKVLLLRNLFCILEDIMDLLKKAAIEFEKLLSTTYYFRIARKNIQKEFMLNFMPEDFHHVVGLHKLIDIGLVQTGARDKVFYDILSEHITFSDISKSNYFLRIEDRLNLVCHMEDILDSNQIVFKYMKTMNQFSRIEADFLLENAHRMDIVYIFLNERSTKDRAQVPTMCCRSFFPMDQLDYTKNQPSYTLLKKIKIDTALGMKTVQYDRSKIIDEAKNAPSEQERRSIMQQLNEKKAQLAINEVLSERRAIQQNRQTPERS